MSGGQDPLFQALWPLTRPPVSLCSSSEDPSFLKFLIFNKKIGNFFEKPIFRPNFSSLPQKFLKNCRSLAPIFPPDQFIRPPVSNSSAPGSVGLCYMALLPCKTIPNTMYIHYQTLSMNPFISSLLYKFTQLWKTNISVLFTAQECRSVQVIIWIEYICIVSKQPVGFHCYCTAITAWP